MSLVVTHTTAADGTFSTAGAAAWNATHTIAGTVDLATETTGTINLLTQTSGAVATRLMYGGGSGQVAQSSSLVWSATNQLLINQASPSDTTSSLHVGGVAVFNNALQISAGSIARISSGNLVFLGRTPLSGPGGQVQMQAGNAAGSSDGGDMIMTAGNAAGTGGRFAGNFQMTGGTASSSDATGTGGGAFITGGTAYNAGGVSGPIQLAGGDSYAGATGGAVTLIPGGIQSGSGIAGDLVLCIGPNFATGTPGNLRVENPDGTDVAVATNVLRTNTKDLPVIVDGVQRYIRLYS